MHYFVSYARGDVSRIKPLIKELQERGFSLWYDAMLAPGEDWREAITQALAQSQGVLVFLSARSVNAQLQAHELDYMAGMDSESVVPVLLDDVSLDVALLGPFQALDVSGLEQAEAVARIAERLVAIAPTRAVTDDHAAQMAGQLAQGYRHQSMSTTKPQSIFIVHGHDLDLRAQVDDFLNGHGIETVILSEIDAWNQSLFQKFLTFSEDVQFAVVLITADDLGASRRQYEAEGVGERALQFRARQNVILELGFFYGYLGWENVFVLFKPADKVFPNFEIPSDLGGILFDEVDPAGAWRVALLDHLRAAGFGV